MAGKIKKESGYVKLLIMIVVVGLLIILLAVTNPSRSEFAAWAVQRSEEDAHPLTEVITSALGEPLIESRTTRQNYIIFSLFEYDDTVTVGILGNFITLEGV